MELIEICRAGNRSGNARLRQQPGEGYSGWRRAVSFRHLVERAQDSETALVQIFLHEGRSRALARSEEHTSELQSHSDLHSFPTRRSSDLLASSREFSPLGRARSGF